MISALFIRYLLGTVDEDDRVRTARLGSVLLLFGAGVGLGLLPVLPQRIDRGLCVALVLLSLLLGTAIPWFPWQRWPHAALGVPLCLALPIVLTGGLVGGDLDYYALYYPLLFIYCGYSFAPRFSGYLFLFTLLGLALTVVCPQQPDAVPFILLSTLLSAVGGLVLALQRQHEQRGHESMRQLVAAASALGAAQHPQEVARLIAATASSLLDAHGVAVLVPTAQGDRLSVSGAAGHETAAGAVGTRARADLLALLAQQQPGRTEITKTAGYGLTDERAHVLITVLLPLSELAVLDAGPDDGRHGAIVCELRGPIRQRDYFTVRALEMLAVEGSRVLERLRQSEKLFAQSRTDPLTGVSNRLVLDGALAASSPGATVILLDLDHFKHVNDQLGHAAGDELLVQFADVLRSVIRAGDVVARYGGEEFTLVLTGVPEPALARYLSHLRRLWSDASPITTYSGGVVVQAVGETGIEALARADRAMYVAKRQGRNQDVVDTEAAGQPGVFSEGVQDAVIS